MNGEVPQIRVNYGLSELDIFTNEKQFWDYHVKLPFKLKKNGRKDRIIRESIRKGWENANL